MSKLQPPRGMKDLIGKEAALHQLIVRRASDYAALYGFEPFATPIIEFTDVFARTLGESSDVVNKEMYSFPDRNDEGLTLRPEFTAGVARAFISNGMQQDLPLKLFSAGPLFRYERPQKGRQRQFHQLNFEHLGDGSPLADVELMTMAAGLLKKLHVKGRVTLRLNSLGDAESREAHREALVAYLAPYRTELSEDSQRRLEQNPLRILDSKDANDQKICAGAPQLSAYYTAGANAFLAAVQEGLSARGIAYVMDHSIVRGLDYYNHTVFEFVVEESELGAQNTVLAGGRYDGLIGQMGGAETPAVGCAAGIERLLLLSALVPERALKVAVIPDGDEFNARALSLLDTLREAGHVAELFAQGNLSKRMKKADKKGASVIAVVGVGEVSLRANTHSGDALCAKLQGLLQGA